MWTTIPPRRGRSHRPRVGGDPRLSSGVRWSRHRRPDDDRRVAALLGWARDVCGSDAPPAVVDLGPCGHAREGPEDAGRPRGGGLPAVLRRTALGAAGPAELVVRRVPDRAGGGLGGRALVASPGAGAG